nr:unnamed protein product [Meloidogyne enterolobii]
MGNNRSSTSSSSATSSYSQYTHSIPNKNFNDKNTRQFWKTSISARESFENSPQQKEETKTRLRNRSLILFQQPKLNKGGGNNNWWPLKRIKNRSIEKKNSYGVPPPPSMLSDEINGEEEIQSLENRPLIDLTVTSSENDSPCSSLPPNQPTTIDDSNTTTTSTTTTTTFISFRPQRCQFLENFDENKNNNNSEFNKHQRRAKSFRHFPSTRTYNNSRRSTR